ENGSSRREGQIDGSDARACEGLLEEHEPDGRGYAREGARVRARRVGGGPGGGGRGRAGRGRRRRGRRAGEGGLHGRPRRGRRQEDPGHQGGARSHRARPQGGKGRGRRGAQAGQGGRAEGRGRGDQEEARRRGRQRGAEVSEPGDAMSTTASAVSRVPNNLRFRRTFGRIKKIIDIPNLIEIQKRSYEEFLQKDVAPEARKDQGLQAVFKSVFPIKDFNETASLEFVSYTLSEPKYDVEECHQRGMTFAAPLKVTVQLVIWDVDPESGVRSIKNVKEQEVYFGEIPLMTRHGTFMINGTERVIVSQLHRSPGVFFDHDKGKTHASGKLLYSARIIPYRGSWIDFEFDPKDILYVRIDRRRKFHATVLLRALGMTTEDLLNYFYRRDTVVLEGRKAAKLFQADHLIGVKASRDIRHPQSNELLVKEGRKFTKMALRQMEQAGVTQIPIALEEVIGRVSAHDVKDAKT